MLSTLASSFMTASRMDGFAYAAAPAAASAPARARAHWFAAIVRRTAG